MDYYVRKQILLSVERILGVFGVDLANLDYDSKHKQACPNFYSWVAGKKDEVGSRKLDSRERDQSNGSQRSLLIFN